MHLWGGIYAIGDSILTNSSGFIMTVKSEIKLVALSHPYEVCKCLFKFGNWEAVIRAAFILKNKTKQNFFLKMT